MARSRNLLEPATLLNIGVRVAPNGDTQLRSGMAQVHLIIGPVGAGKSTFASTLCQQHGAIRLTLDDWMTQLFRPDRPEHDVMPWYLERVERCITQIWKLTLDLLDHGSDVVLEIGLIQRAQRQRFYQRVDDAERALRVYWVDAPREVRRARVAKRNLERGQTFSMEVPPDFFELASNLWEPPDAGETVARDVCVLASGQPQAT